MIMIIIIIILRGPARLIQQPVGARAQLPLLGLRAVPNEGLFFGAQGQGAANTNDKAK